jgi:flagellar hook-basal body complex protein FliE
MPVDPTFAVNGPEWRIDAPAAPAPVQEQGEGFGAVLGKSLQALSATQAEASQAAHALAAGQAEDPTAVVMAVERAQLAMQLASQIRTKAVEAAQDIFHTQV